MTQRISEHDQYLLSRLLDGDLPAEEADGLRVRLEREPELNEVFEEFQQINRALMARRADQADVDFDTFHADVMEAVEAERAGADEADTVHSGSGRILRFPGWFKTALPVAAAAAIALVVTLSDRLGPAPDRRDGTSDSPLAVEKSGQDRRNGNAGQIARDPESEAKSGSGESSMMVSVAANRNRDPGSMVVRFNRPAGTPSSEQHVVRVNFQRSASLAQQMQQQDRAEKNRPSIAAATPIADEPEEIFIDLDLAPL